MTGSEAWTAATEIRDGLGGPKKISFVKLKKKDGTVCKTAEDAAEARKEHFESLFGREPTFDLPSTLTSSRLSHSSLWLYLWATRQQWQT